MHSGGRAQLQLTGQDSGLGPDRRVNPGPEDGAMSTKCYVGRRRKMTVQDWTRLGWAQEHAERYALLDHTTAEVVVLEEDGVRPLAHHVRHSPNGFGWG